MSTVLIKLNKVQTNTENDKDSNIFLKNSPILFAWLSRNVANYDELYHLLHNTTSVFCLSCLYSISSL